MDCLQFVLVVNEDLTLKNVLWRFSKSLPNISFPLLYNGVIYMVKDGGVVTSLDANTGVLLKQARLPEALDPYFASPIAGGEGKIFLVSQTGKVSVLRARGDWEILAVDDLAEDCYATPAIAGGNLYVGASQYSLLLRKPHLMGQSGFPGGFRFPVLVGQKTGS